MSGGRRRGRNREQSAFVYFGVSDQAGDIMVLQQRVGEYLGRGEAGAWLDATRAVGDGHTAALQLTRRRAISAPNERLGAP